MNANSFLTHIKAYSQKTICIPCEEQHYGGPFFVPEREHSFFLSAMFSLLRYSVENLNQKRKKREKKKKNKRKNLLGIALVKKIAYT